MWPEPVVVHLEARDSSWASALTGGIELEVQGPDLIGPRGDHLIDRARATAALASAGLTCSFSSRQRRWTFLVFTLQPFLRELDPHPAIAPTGMAPGDVAEPDPQALLGRWSDRCGASLGGAGLAHGRQARRSDAPKRCWHRLRPAGAARGSGVSPGDLLQHVDVERLVGHELLQPAVSPSSLRSRLASSGLSSP